MTNFLIIVFGVFFVIFIILLVRHKIYNKYRNSIYNEYDKCCDLYEKFNNFSKRKTTEKLTKISNEFEIEYSKFVDFATSERLYEINLKTLIAHTKKVEDFSNKIQLLYSQISLYQSIILFEK